MMSQMTFKPRPNQVQVLAYRGGLMGVSAVPGSGKTTTLSMLAADLITAGNLEDGQEVLIVTLVNSAVDNFSARVGGFVKARGLLPNVGYRVRTLHGLAHDIVRERPDLAGVSEGFDIADELTAERILRLVSDRWAYEHAEVLEAYLRSDLSDSDQKKIRRRNWPELVRTVSDAFIRTCKDYRISPGHIREKLEADGRDLLLVRLGNGVYEEYERALTIRGLLDFNDLIVRALQAMEADPLFLENLRFRWPYILEDEAQDSSRLQEQILRLLVGQKGNWVRVGDPNQAIFETFTTASPDFLRNFLREESVVAQTLPHSGRSTLSIIDLANQLIRWSEFEHPAPELRGALRQPYIKPSPPDDPQPNPPDQPEGIHLVDTPYTAQEELDAVIASAERWVSENPERTVAVLVPRNVRGAQLVEGLQAKGVPYVELLRSTETTRNIARALSEVLKHLAHPDLPGSIADAFSAWQWNRDGGEDSGSSQQQARDLLRGCTHVETFAWPAPGHDWLEDLDGEVSEKIRDLLTEFRMILQRWHAAVVLPVDQLILTISQDLGLGHDELALVYRFSLAMSRIQRSNPAWGFSDLADELERIANNQRRFIGFGDLESAFVPERYPGQVVVATMHKAKGLEWDRVYILAANQYNFPSLAEDDTYISERWFLRDQLNLQAEALAQMDSLLEEDESNLYEEGKATLEARIDYAAERLRLFFVGVTRAKRELVVTWNLGRRDDLKAAMPFKMLLEYWGSQRD